MEESEKKIILLESDVIKLLEVAKKNRTSKIGELLGMKYLVFAIFIFTIL